MRQKRKVVIRMTDDEAEVVALLLGNIVDSGAVSESDGGCRETIDAIVVRVRDALRRTSEGAK